MRHKMVQARMVDLPLMKAHTRTTRQRQSGQRVPEPARGEREGWTMMMALKSTSENESSLIRGSSVSHIQYYGSCRMPRAYEGKTICLPKARDELTCIGCEACRRGKRKCEPHPLVPLDHPDIARLPCERCRRFALECVRERAPKRKGPAPTDLSAISDAMHGFAAEDGGAAGASEMHGDGRAANGGAGGNGQISREAGANGMGNAIAGPSRAAGQSQEQVPQMPQQFSQDQSHLMGSHGGEMHASGSGSGSGIGLGFGDVNGGLAPGLQHQGSGPSSAPR